MAALSRGPVHGAAAAAPLGTADTLGATAGPTRGVQTLAGELVGLTRGESVAGTPADD